MLRAEGSAVSRDRRSAGDSNLYSGRHGRTRDQEVSGEMQCVTFHNTWLPGWMVNSPRTRPLKSSNTSQACEPCRGRSPHTRKRVAASPPTTTATTQTALAPKPQRKLPLWVPIAAATAAAAAIVLLALLPRVRQDRSTGFLRRQPLRLRRSPWRFLPRRSSLRQSDTW